LNITCKSNPIKMKYAVVFFAFCATAYGGLLAPAIPAIGIVNTGASAQFRSQDVSVVLYYQTFG
jgi:hypothetical protein